jgi:EmrB/QacA subfamily drug resistance transporter
VLAATILGSSMAFIEGTVVNVALPVLQLDLGATAADVQWVVQAYSLVLASLILVGGSLGDRFGRRRIFALGVALFTVASAWCGLAPELGQLIVARVAQGVGGALLVPGSLAIISATFSGEERGRAIGTWSGFTAITMAIGPVLGGWLIENVSWRWVFYMNLPLAVIVLAITLIHVPESRDDSSGRLDWAGALLATVGLGGLVYGLTEAAVRGWTDPMVLVALALGVGALVSFVVVESRLRAPMVPLGLFRARTFTGANLLTLLLYAALGGALYYVPFNLLQVQGYTATGAGAALLPMILLMFGLSRWAGGLVHRYGARRPLIIGPFIAAVGFALFALPGVGGSYWTSVFPAIVVLGLGMTITVAPLTTTVMNAVEERHSGLASGINNAISRAGGVLAIATFSIVVTGIFNRSLDDRVADLGLPAAAQDEIAAEREQLAAIAAPEGLDAETAAAVDGAVDESFVAGFRVAMLLGAALAAASAFVSWRMIEERPRS